MKILIPGSFDPPTNGHIDVINRCSEIFNEIIVGVVVNPSKESLFTPEERSEMLLEICKEKENVKVKSFEGLLVDFASSESVNAIVKGLRAMTDFDYEFQMAQANSTLKGYETIFIPSSPEYGYLSSSMVKEIHSYGGDIKSLVPEYVLERMNNV
tara:strand:+ start:2102 stop:2566 length:465 start_codon:yes stop_codon:yes gene_type:complete